MKTLRELTDKRLVAEIKALNAKEHEATIELLLHINELERRKLYRELGYATVFAYLTEELKYSAPSASRRVAASRLICKYPSAKQLLEQKQISLTTTAKISGIVTDENIAEVLEAVAGKSASEVDSYVAFYRPKQAVREYVKPVAVAQPKIQVKNNSCSKSIFIDENENQTTVATPNPKQFFDVKFLADEEFMENFKEVERLLSGKFPAGLKPKELFAELMAFYLKHKCPKQKQHRIGRRKKPSSPTSSQAVSAHDRRKALLKSGQRCEYISDDGTRCSCTWDLEIDHIQPKAMGGSNVSENLRVLCRAHNLMFAEKYFGAGRK